MKICLIELDKSKVFKEIEPPIEISNPSIMAVEDRYIIDSEGNKVPIYIPRMGNEATQNLCDYVFATYKNNNSE